MKTGLAVRRLSSSRPSNTLTRTGGYEPNWADQFGGLWLFADTSDIVAALVVKDLTIQDSTYEGLYISGSHRVLGAVFDGVTINGATTYGIQIKSGACPFQAWGGYAPHAPPRGVDVRNSTPCLRADFRSKCDSDDCPSSAMNLSARPSGDWPGTRRTCRPSRPTSARSPSSCAGTRRTPCQRRSTST